jgi:hypothetical protein
LKEKAHNILIETGSNRLALVDFGLVKLDEKSSGSEASFTLSTEAPWFPSN